MWARIHLIPLLQAEEDRDQVRRYWADQQREKELLGENAKVYHTDKYVSDSLPVSPWSLGVCAFCCCCLTANIGTFCRFVRPTLTVAPPPSK